MDSTVLRTVIQEAMASTRVIKVTLDPLTSYEGPNFLNVMRKKDIGLLAFSEEQSVQLAALALVWQRGGARRSAGDVFIYQVTLTERFVSEDRIEVFVGMMAEHLLDARIVPTQPGD